MRLLFIPCEPHTRISSPRAFSTCSAEIAETELVARFQCATVARCQMNTPKFPDPSCLLTSQGGGYYAGKPGLLQLTIKDVKGSTQLNISKSLVWDITNLPQQVAVIRTCAATTLSFTIEAGKTYHVQLECSQVPPYDSEAFLVEACGQQLATINVVNLMPGLVVSA
jgi:hypothetical protein